VKRLIILAALVACGGKAVFRLSSDENNAYALRQTLAQRQLPAAPTPVNDSHQPRVFAVTSQRAIVAFDLAAGTALWTQPADVQSRIAVGGDFIVALEGKQLVGRDQARGGVRWRADVPGTFVGVAADRERAYLVYKTGSRWWLAGYSGRAGDRLWKADASGQLGAPAAHGGVVYVPFLSQWLAIVDGKHGTQLTRIRGLDEQIVMVRATSQRAYYGSKAGVFALDERSASGRRADATYGTIAVPPQLERTSYGPDAYDPVQAGYSASDRARILWTSPATASTALQFDGCAIHYFRFVFGCDPVGGIRWAYSHPRVELVASAHTGAVIAAVSSTGEVVALDARTGAVRAKLQLPAGGGAVLGATFDADGWAPVQLNEPVATVAALVSIARDHDARFDRVKELAVSALAKLPGPEVTKELLGVLADDRAPARLKDTVAELLVVRRDPSSLPVLVQQLAVHADFLAQTQAEALGPTARALAGLAGDKLDRAQVTAAVAALETHLDAPTTAPADLAQVIDALAALGGAGGALGSHLLLYHADDELGGDPVWQKAIVGALARSGPAERATLRHVAADPRTRPGLAGMIRDTLGAE
jgi:outer membrane protein assembly factor BamB